jgi:hypothetical protein
MVPPKGAAPRPSERVLGDLAWLGHGSERSRFGDLVRSPIFRRISLSVPSSPSS